MLQPNVSNETAVTLAGRAEFFNTTTDVVVEHPFNKKIEGLSN